MQYVNTVKVIPAVWNNIKLFRSGKEADNNLFDKIDAQALNDYLKSQMEGLTAKVFRTYNASNTLQQELNRVDLAGLSME
jgi:DNA topoisomerase-1